MWPTQVGREPELGSARTLTLIYQPDWIASDGPAGEGGVEGGVTERNTRCQLLGSDGELLQRATMRSAQQRAISAL